MTCVKRVSTGLTCDCNPGHYSPSGKAPTEVADCEPRLTRAKFRIEFTAGSDYKWDTVGNTFKWFDGMYWQLGSTFTSDKYEEFKNLILTLPDGAKTFGNYDGSTSVSVTGSPTFSQNKKSPEQAQVKGLEVEYTWDGKDISAPSTLLTDLKTHVKAAIMKFINDRNGHVMATNGDAIESIVVEPFADYPQWGEWGAFGDCGSDCTRTREMKCPSQLPCVKDAKNTWKETEFCTSAECGKFTSWASMRYHPIL